MRYIEKNALLLWMKKHGLSNDMVFRHVQRVKGLDIEAVIKEIHDGVYQQGVKDGAEEALAKVWFDAETSTDMDTDEELLMISKKRFEEIMEERQ